MKDSSDEYAAGWRRLAERTARRVNFGWWLSCFAPGAVVLGIVAFSVVFYLRSRGVIPGAGELGAWLSGAFVLVAAGAWLLARRKFFSVDDGMVRLEARLRLHNALSAAAAGVTSWPPPPRRVDDGFRFDWRWAVLPSLLTALLVSGGLLIPVVVEAAETAEVPPPRSHDELQKMIDTLRKQEVAKPEDLDKLQQQLDELKNQPAGQWYSHSSLEAADSLKAGLIQQLNGMAGHLDKAAQSMSALSEFSDQLSAAEQQRLAGEFQSSVEGLRNASPGLNQKLMDALSKIDPSQLKSLAQSDVQKMLEALKKASGA